MKAGKPDPVKLFIAAILSPNAEEQKMISRLESEFGGIDYFSKKFPVAEKELKKASRFIKELGVVP